MKMNDLRRGLCLLAALMMLAASVPVSAFAQELPATVHADAAEPQAAPAAENNAAQGVPVNETNFPDPAFRAWLLRPENLNGAGADGLLTDAELQAVTVMDVSNQGIASLQGIGYFTQLESLVSRRSGAGLDADPQTQITKAKGRYPSGIPALSLPLQFEKAGRLSPPWGQGPARPSARACPGCTARSHHPAPCPASRSPA